MFKISKKILFIVAEAIIVFDFVLSPVAAPVYAQTFHKSNNLKTRFSQIKTNISQNKIETSILPQLPIAEPLRPKIIKFSVLTAYSSEVSQCDASPCITATGFNVCQHKEEDTVAANFLPLGAKIRIPQYFGNRVFIVRDRMNPRYHNRIDIWMTTRDKAIKFGVKKARIEILDY